MASEKPTSSEWEHADHKADTSLDLSQRHGNGQTVEKDVGNGQTVETGDAAAFEVNDDPKALRRALLKLDLSTVPIVALLYFLSFLDRANIGNARVAGLQKDLRLTDHQYSIVLTTLYVPYICAELPGNLLLRKISPKIFLPLVCTIWGVICTLQGLVTSYGGLLAARFFLGLVEGPMFPGIVLYLSSFYTRAELQFRVALFFSTASLSGAFSGLLAAAIVHMNGIGGKPGWAWIFILEGLLTFLVGVASFFVMQDSPATNRFLKPHERELLTRRLHEDRPTVQDLEEPFSWYQVWASVRSPHVLLNFVALFFSGAALYSLAYFVPSIVNSLGYDPIRSQLLSVPPFAVAFVYMIVTGWLADHYRARALTASISALLGMIGFVLFFTSTEKSIRYGSLFLSVTGIYATPPPLSVIMAVGSEPHYRRAVSIAAGFVATNAGGILSTWMFPSKQSPRYRTGTIVCLSFSIGICVFSTLTTLYLRRANRRKVERREELLAPFQGMENGEQEAWRRLGDRHPDFKYTY